MRPAPTTAERRPRVLVAQPLLRDVEALLKELERGSLAVEALCVSSHAELLDRVDASIDLILTDLGSPGVDPLAVIDLVAARAPGLPIVVVSRSLPDDVVVEVLRRGAADYVHKDRLAPLAAAVRRALERRRVAEEHWHASAVIAASPDAIIDITLAGLVLSWNPSAAKLYGYAADEMTGASMSVIVPPDKRAELADILDRVARGERVERLETVRVRKDRGRVAVSLTVLPVTSPCGGVSSVVTIAQNITASQQAASELRRTEKERDWFFDLSRDILLVGGFDGYVKRVNPACERTLGFSAEELYAQPFVAFVHDDDKAAVAHEIEGLAGGQETVSFETRMLCKDGPVRWVEWNAMPSSDEGIYAVGRDVTDRKNAEAALDAEARISNALARAGRELIALLETPLLLDHLCDLSSELLGGQYSITWLDDRGTDTYMARCHHGLGQAQWDEVARLRLPAAAFTVLAERLRRDDIVLIIGGDPTFGPLARLRERHEVTMTAYLALRRGDELIGVQSVGYCGRTAPFTDPEERTARGITHLAAMALSNARLVEELERASRLKSEFVSTMSHELRTPLNVIIGYTEMLGDEVRGEGVRALSQIRKASLDLLELVQSTLDLSRIAAGTDTIQLEPVAARPLMQDLAGDFAPARKNGVALRWVPEGAVELRTDRRKLEHILKNLVQNALKFTARGEVVVSAKRVGDRCVFEVRDTGIGIASAELPHIFEMFRQGDSSDARAYGGTGLGLYIVRQLLEQLGGDIEVESIPGRGSIFRVVLPCVPDAESGAGLRAAPSISRRTRVAGSASAADR